MLLFKKAFHQGLLSGAITLTFRRWQKPHVRPGGRYRCHPIGVLEVEEVAKVMVQTITEEDALRAGFESLAVLHGFLAELGEIEDETEIYRVQLRHGGDGDRVELALETELGAEDIATIRAKLKRMDGDDPWTTKTMNIIEKHPRIAASQLAAKLGRETLEFKTDVRKLKKLGLTQSFEVGYELSPRGKAYREKIKRPSRR